MRRRVRLTESDLNRIVRESVKRILSEEVDLGQIDAMRDRPRAKEYSKEDKKRIWELRNLIDDYEKEGKDTSDITKEIRCIKEKYQ